MYRIISRKLLTLLFTVMVGVTALNVMVQPVSAQLRLGEICRVKGQEENTLHGLGLVVGLNGTGDGDIKPTTRALASMLSLMGSPLPRGPDGEEILVELADADNVALALVTVTIPAAGARQGDKLNCHVSAVSADSLEGGYLMTTALLGPRPGNGRVYGFATGLIHVDDEDHPTNGRIHLGCRLEEDFFNAYTSNGKITLVLQQDHASFQTAQDIANQINSNQPLLEGSSDRYAAANQEPLARALDQLNVEVRIPDQYLEYPVNFISLVLNLRLVTPTGEARVVVNERAGTVVFGADVVIGPVAITHNGLTIQTGEEVPVSQFVGIDQTGAGSTRLQSLVQALNELRVPPADIIEIIKGIERNGKLYGTLIVE